MSLGLIGKKCGMTRIFSEQGVSIPITVIEVTSNWITQIKTQAKEGYDALQLTAGFKKPVRLKKPEKGHFAKAKVPAGNKLKEFRLTPEQLKQKDYQVGQALEIVDVFEVGQKIKLTANTKGRGFTGVIKRHNFKSQRATHGNSLSHNAPGSIGQNQTPGKVFKGKKMAGHYGNEKCSVKNLQIVQIDSINKALLVKGAVPGPKGQDVIITLF